MAESLALENLVVIVNIFIPTKFCYYEQEKLLENSNWHLKI